MNKNRKKLSVYIFLTVLITAVACGLRTSACLLDFNFNSGFFDDKILILCGNIIVAVGALFFLTYPIIHTKCNLKPSFNTPSTYIPTGIVGVALVFFSQSLATKLFSDGFGNFQFPNFKDLKNIMGVLAVVLALLCIVHFFLNAFLSEEHSTSRAWASLFTIAFLAVYSSYLYFTVDLPLNAPNKIVDQLAFLSSALFFLYESRISLGREKWGWYCGFGFISSMLCAYSSIPSLITYFIKGETISHTVAENVLTLTLCIFIFARLTLVLKLHRTDDNKHILIMDEASKERIRETEELESAYEALFREKEEKELEVNLGTVDEELEETSETDIQEFEEETATQSSVTDTEGNEEKDDSVSPSEEIKAEAVEETEENSDTQEENEKLRSADESTDKE